MKTRLVIISWYVRGRWHAEKRATDASLRALIDTFKSFRSSEYPVVAVSAKEVRE